MRLGISAEFYQNLEKNCITALLQFFKGTNNHCLGCQLQSFKHCISDVALVSKFQFCNIKLGYFSVIWGEKDIIFSWECDPILAIKQVKKNRNVSKRHTSDAPTFPPLSQKFQMDKMCL